MRPLLVALALVACAPLAIAQTDGRLDARHQQTLVTFTLRADIADITRVAVPAALAQLADDERLARLDLTTQQQSMQQIEAEFVFGSMADYITWRESERTVALLTELDQGSPRRLESVVRVRRSPLMSLLPGEG